jgi:hypothetical protein
VQLDERSKQIEDQLAQAERHVVIGSRHVATQRELLNKLERDGHDPSKAWSLLTQFEELLAMHIADRDRLRKKLEALGR